MLRKPLFKKTTKPLMKTPKVSICIPTYKQVEYLRRTLESIQMQSFHDYEVVITDDSPDDSVKNVVETFEFQGKLKYFKNTISLGSPENFNEAVKNAVGDYIKMMMHDDWFNDELGLEKFVELLDKNPDADFGFSASLVWKVEPEKCWINKASKYQLENLHRDPKSLFFVNFLGAPSATIYRKMVDLKYDPKLKWIPDLDFAIAMLCKNNKFAFCEEPLVCVSDGAEHQVTRICENNKEIELFEYLHLFKKIQDSNLSLKEYRPFFKDLFARYNVKSYDELQELGIDLPQLEGWFKSIILMSRLRILKESFVSNFKIRKESFLRTGNTKVK
jgi:glycosyltransferase involved in cell wall biosynthesis